MGLLGSRGALALALVLASCAVALGCASSTRRGGVDAGVDAGRDAGRIGRRDGGGFEPDSPYAYDAYVDPGCDAGGVVPDVVHECDPFVPTSCPAGSGCYPYVAYPEGGCGEEGYGAFCAPSGPGTQGDHCFGGTDCAPGYHCFVTGEGTQCLKLCDQSRIPADCPRGLVCTGTDLMGFGACF